MTPILRIILTFCVAAVAFAQPPSRPEFEVASIRPSAELPLGTGAAGVRIDGAQVRCTYLSMKDYLAMAYQVKLYQVAGPDWLGSERFDIVATLPAGASQAKIPEMLQALLVDRFQVKIHRDKKEFPVYALEVAKGGPRLKETPPDSNADSGDAKGGVSVAAAGSANGVGVNLGNGSSYALASNRFEARKLSMATLADSLERFVDRPIVDSTELKGNYDFTLELTPEDYGAMLIRSAISAGVVLPPQALRALDYGSLGSLFDALQKQGLKLDARKAPLDVLVVDQARKTPTEN